MVVCLEQGADLHMAQLMPLPLTVPCFTKIQIGFTFLVPAHLGSPGKRAVKRVCVCVCALFAILTCEDSCTCYNFLELEVLGWMSCLISQECDQSFGPILLHTSSELFCLFRKWWCIKICLILARFLWLFIIRKEDLYSAIRS